MDVKVVVVIQNRMMAVFDEIADRGWSKDWNRQRLGIIACLITAVPHHAIDRMLVGHRRSCMGRRRISFVAVTAVFKWSTVKSKVSRDRRYPRSAARRSIELADGWIFSPRRNECECIMRRGLLALLLARRHLCVLFFPCRWRRQRGKGGELVDSAATLRFSSSVERWKDLALCCRRGRS